MEITARHEFAADPDTVAQMLIDRDFWTRVCQASDALSYDVETSENGSRVSRTMPTPSVAQKFVKGDIEIVQELRWDERQQDGSRHGAMTVTSPGLSFLHMRGEAQLRPGGPGTIADYRGDFEISIPFVGNKLEKQAAPVISNALDLQQSIGNEWLNERR